MPIETKRHLADLFRVDLDGKSRKGCLRLDMNENVSGLPEDFVKEVLSGIDAGHIAAYPEYRGLKEKIAAHNGIEVKNICLSNGSDAAIKYIFDAYISPGERVLMTDPTFAMYPVYCNMFNAVPLIAEYRRDLSFPEDDFLRMLNEGVKMAVIVNPNNPTGSILQKGKIQSIIDKCAAKDIIIVIDEAYFYYCPETLIRLVNEYKNLIVLRTFSKLCGIASLRIGYAAACPEIISGLSKVKPTFDVNSLAVLFAEKILDSPGVIQDLVEATNEGKAFLGEKLAEAGMKYVAGGANFILINCPDRVREIIDGLAGRNILVGGAFRQEFLKDYVRVTVGDKKSMEVFWEAFSEIWKTGR